MLNPTIFRLLGDVAGARVMDAGCGQGYLCRLLADRGASVVGVEPAQALFDYAVAKEHQRRQGIQYVQADLAELPDLGEALDLSERHGQAGLLPDRAGRARLGPRACLRGFPGGRPRPQLRRRRRTQGLINRSTPTADPCGGG
jgi:SAM-dependent methyltransferase